MSRGKPPSRGAGATPRSEAAAKARAEGRLAVARNLYLAELRDSPKSRPALNGLGLVAYAERKIEPALDFLRRAVKADPNSLTARLNLAMVLHEGARDFEAALACLREAVRLHPESAKALRALGELMEHRRRPDMAIEAFSRAVALDPRDVDSRLGLMSAKRAVCHWEGYDEDEQALLGLLRDGVRMQPINVLSLGSTLAEQQIAAARWGAKFIQPAALWRPRQRAPGEQLRIGYLSGDFHEHATAYLIPEMLERRDRARFRVELFSYGPTEDTPARRRLMQGADAFHDLSALTDSKAAALIAEAGIDILVDLKGYTQDSRTGIAGYRPAPIQVNYLGFPGAMGVPFIDYVITDPRVCPMEYQPWCAERIVHLPDCFQPNDRRREIAPGELTRDAAGLPPGRFVFCAFANPYKITPTIFGAWMRILAQTPGSLLVLYAKTQAQTKNLAREAAARGVDPARVLFAGPEPQARHLRRLQLADLCLDTLPVSAFTSASDALWAGAPILTVAGKTPAGRGSVSLLWAMGLPQLITESLEQFEAEAVALAKDPARLSAIRARIAANRLTAPLFDSARHTRHLEAAYQEMWRRHAAGEAPQPFAVEPIP